MAYLSPTIAAFLESSDFNQLRAELGDRRVILGEDTEKYSKDFYWYSPVLRKQLDEKRADIVLMIESLDQLKMAVAALYGHGVPITVRGAGTGNYGQAIPIYGGAVLDVSRMNKIFEVENGVAKVEPGALMRKVEREAMKHGWELRCMPSTWVTATMGGFLCGGSGGIGSVKYGGINYGDNIKSVSLLTVEDAPRVLKFEEREAIKALHTYGTTGIMVEIEMRLGEAQPWLQMVCAHENWDTMLDWTHEIAADPQIDKRLVTFFEKPIPPYFKPMAEYLPEGKHVSFLFVDEADADRVRSMAAARGVEITYEKPYGNPPKPPYITEFTWNHTTLWALKSVPTITYLQCGFGVRGFKEKFLKLHERFPGEIEFHLEFTLNNAKMSIEEPGVQVGGIPLVHFKSEERLQEIIDYCHEIGVQVANPHTYKLEEGGAHPDIKEKRALKEEADPKALLNPGKMKTYPVNPFETVGVA